LKAARTKAKAEGGPFAAGTIVATSYGTGPYEVVSATHSANGWNLTLKGWGATGQADSYLNCLKTHSDGGWWSGPEEAKADRIYVIRPDVEPFAGARSLSSFEEETKLGFRYGDDLWIGGELKRLVVANIVPDDGDGAERFLLVVRGKEDDPAMAEALRVSRDSSGILVDHLDRGILHAAGEPSLREVPNNVTAVKDISATAIADKVPERYEPALPIELVDESPRNPRQFYDQVALEELAASIKAVGLAQPVLVRPRGNRYELVYGHRRLRASVIAGMPTIKATVRDLTDVEVAEIQLIENNQRADVRPLEEARAYRNALDSGAYGEGKAAVAALAAKVGRSVSYVYGRLQLLDLIPEAQEELTHGNISAGHAGLMLPLTAEGQKECLDELLYERKWDNGLGRYVRAKRLDECARSVRQLADYIGSRLTQDLAKAPFEPTDAELLPQIGACTSCPRRQVGPATNLLGRCLDKACYREKAGAARTRKATKAIVANPGAQWISFSSQTEDPAVLPNDCWQHAKEGAPGAVLAVVVDGFRDDMIGEVHWVRLTATPEQRALAKDAHAAEEERKKLRGVVERDFRRRLFDGVKSLNGGNLGNDLLRMAIGDLWAKLYGDPQRAACGALGWSKKMTQEEARYRIRVATDEELATLLLVFVTYHEVHAGDWELCDSDRKPERLLDLAKVYGVDVDHLRREAEEKHAPKVVRDPVQTSGPDEQPAEKTAQGTLL
jgi:ParB/RepB/Spo0J family partition protein